MSGYPKKVKEKALMLYKAGERIETISHRKDMPSKQTLWAWKKKFNWGSKKKKADERADKILDETLTDIALRQRKIIKGLLARSIPALITKLEQEGGSIKDVIDLLRHELHLEGKASSSLEITFRDRFEKAYKEITKDYNDSKDSD